MRRLRADTNTESGRAHMFHDRHCLNHMLDTSCLYSPAPCSQSSHDHMELKHRCSAASSNVLSCRNTHTSKVESKSCPVGWTVENQFSSSFVHEQSWSHPNMLTVRLLKNTWRLETQDNVKRRDTCAHWPMRMTHTSVTRYTTRCRWRVHCLFRLDRKKLWQRFDPVRRWQ